jgi:hypothetical protein
MSQTEPLYEYALTDNENFAAFNCDVLRNPLPAMESFFDAIGMISQPTDPDAHGFDPLPDPSRYLKEDHLGLYQYPVNQALAYVTQDGVGDASPQQFWRIAKTSLRQMLEDHPVPAPVPGSAPLAWVLIKLPGVEKQRSVMRAGVTKKRRDGKNRRVVRRVVHMDGDTRL